MIEKYLVLIVKVSGAVPPLPYMSSWHAQGQHFLPLLCNVLTSMPTVAAV